MAEALQRQHSLPVVKVRLREHDGQPAIGIELVRNVKGEQVVDESLIERLTRYGLEGRRREPEPVVPDDVVRWVARWVSAKIDPDGTGQVVVWIHLVKPYGILGAIPWERALVPGCGVAFLRLPDVLPLAERPTTTYDVALFVVHPDPAVPSVIDAIRHGIRRAVRVHVFAAPPARAQIPRSADDKTLIVHEPQGVTRTRRTKPGAPPHPWLEWVRDALSDRTVDAVHFIAHGARLGVDGALDLPAPEQTEPRFERPLQAAELRAFLMDVGALVVGFTAPVRNRSPFALLRLVDELGALRAGPVILHDPAHSRGPYGLEEAYTLVTADEPGRPPVDPGLVLFAQPRRVATMLDENVPKISSFPARSSAVEEHLRKPETPRWVAAAECYIAEQQAELIRFRESTERPTSTQIAHYNGVASGLEKIRATVDRHAKARL